MKRTNIGGQAVIEGVMMRGQNMYAIAVRSTKTNEINIEEKDIKKVNSKFLKLPLVRGCYSFVTSMILGFELISKSIDLAEVEEEESTSKVEQWIIDKLGDKLNSVIMGISFVIAMVISIGLFFLLPTFIASLMHLPNTYLLSIVEGIVRLIIFIAYLLLISKNGDIQRLFGYHGAEHKTINCFEHEDELTIENVKKHTRFHKRCGTSFLAFVIIISILFFMFVRTDDILIRFISRIVFIPVIAGLSYEVIRLAGKNDNKFIDILSAPGVWLQKITTNEPDDSQIEVAIKSMNAVLAREGENDENK